MLAGTAVVGILPHLRNVISQGSTLPSPTWCWILLASVAIASSYWFSGLALQAAVGARLPMRRTVLVQLAAAVANRITPGSVGGAAINVRYLTNLGFSVGTAGAALAASGTAHVAVAILGLLLFGPAALSRDARHVTAWIDAWIGGAWPWVLGGAILVATLTIAVLGSRRQRITAPGYVRSTVSDGVRAVRTMMSEPARVGTLLTCVAAVKAANLLALYATLWAFDGDVAGWRVAVAYLVGATSVEAIPTPGGLGTVDAALVLGLVGAAPSARAVLAAVVVYRLLAFWAPIVPGMVSSAFLRRRAAL